MIDSRTFPLGRTYGIGILLGSYATAVALAPGAAQAMMLAPLLAAPILLWMLAKPARWLIAFLASALLLPPLPIPLGDTGPHLCLGIASLGAFVGLLRMGEWKLRLEPLYLGILVYCGILAASVGFAAIYSGPQIAAASLARVMLFGISIYIFFYTALGPGSEEWWREARSLRIVYWAGVASALFACIDFYFQLPAPSGFGPQFVWLESDVFRRAQGVFYEASTLGNLCAFFLVVIAVALTRPGFQHGEMMLSRVALSAGGVVFASALMLSFSRASLINVLVSVAVLVFLQRRRIAWRRLMLLPPLSLTAGAIAAYFLFPQFTAFYWERLRASAAYFFTATEGILSGRLESWAILTQFLLEHPWHALFGIGYKTLPYSDFVGRPVIADNAYLSALVETGIVGLGAMLLLSFAVLRISYRAARCRDSRRAFFGMCLFCFWIGEMLQMMSGDLMTYWRVLPVYFWLLGMAARSLPDERSPGRSVQ
jgi:O-antigen ligase